MLRVILFDFNGDIAADETHAPSLPPAGVGLAGSVDHEG